MRELRGVYLSVPTPFRGETLALDGLRAQPRALEPAPLAGYVVLGSAGEFPLLAEAERDRLLVAAREAMPARQGADRGHRRRLDAPDDPADEAGRGDRRRRGAGAHPALLHAVVLGGSGADPPLHGGGGRLADSRRRSTTRPPTPAISLERRHRGPHRAASERVRDRGLRRATSRTRAQIIHLTPKSFHVLVGSAAGAPAVAGHRRGGRRPGARRHRRARARGDPRAGRGRAGGKRRRSSRRG